MASLKLLSTCKTLFVITCAAAWLCTSGAKAAEASGDDGQRVNLSATASVEASHDWLSLRLGTTRDGVDPAVVQQQLKAALENALGHLRPWQQPGRLELQSGQFSMSPRYGKDGKPTGWTGSVELTVEGRDFEKITQVTGQVQTLVLQGLQFGLSQQARAALESDLQARAIERFKTKAQEIAKSFGFAGYNLVQVTVGATDQSGVQPRPLMALAARASMADSMPVPTEPGKSVLQLNVSGTIRIK